MYMYYTILYACIPHYKKIKSKRKFKIGNIKLSKISLPTVVCGPKLVHSGNTGGKPKLIIFLDKARLQYRRQNEVVLTVK